MPQPHEHQPDESRDETERRGPAIPTISVNAAEQDPDPSDLSSDTTARAKASDYDNDREDLPAEGGRS